MNTFKNISSDPTLEVLSTSTERESIYYHDGYVENTFVFNKSIDYNKFVEWLSVNNFLIRDKDNAAWYEDYSKISGEGNTWVHTRVMRYTD